MSRRKGHRHLQVIADQPPHLVAFFRVEFQSRQQAIGQLHTLHRVIAAAPRLPRVVHQHRQEEEVEPVDLRQQGRERRSQARCGWRRA